VLERERRGSESCEEAADQHWRGPAPSLRLIQPQAEQHQTDAERARACQVESLRRRRSRNVSWQLFSGGGGGFLSNPAVTAALAGIAANAISNAVGGGNK